MGSYFCANLGERGRFVVVTILRAAFKAFETAPERHVNAANARTQ